MLLLVLWQVPLFILLPFFFLGMGLFFFIIVQFIRSRLFGQYNRVKITPPKDEWGE